MSTKPGRYLLFIGQRYYPAGGANDFHGAYPTIDVAVRRGRMHVTADSLEDWWNVLDTETGATVMSGERYSDAFGGEWQFRERIGC